jgi:hypothetical protein
VRLWKCAFPVNSMAVKQLTFLAAGAPLQKGGA